jgi:hypothetical protein
MAIPRTSSARSCQIATTSPYRSARSSRVDHFDEDRTRDTAAGFAVGVVGLTIERDAGPGVLDHPVDDTRVPQRPPQVVVYPGPHVIGVFRHHASGPALITHSAGRSVCPKKNQSHQANANRASARAPRLGCSRGQRARHRPGLVERQAVGHGRPPIVADDAESRVPEPAHQLDDVRGHRALRRLRVIRPRLRHGRLPVPAEIRADDGELLASRPATTCQVACVLG